MATVVGRKLNMVALTAVWFAALPGVARASEVSVASPGSPLRMGVSLLGLIVAVALLIEALTVRKVALGGAIAEKISYVVLAILCLSASALAQWTGNFVEGLSADQIGLGSELLVIVAMALLAVYFYSVRKAMQDYLKAMTGAQALQTESTGEERDGTGA